MIVTSLLRGRLNRSLWRAVHLLAYAELAGRVRAQHRLEQGPAAGWLLGLAVACALIVAAAVSLAAGSRRPAGAQGPRGSPRSQTRRRAREDQPMVSEHGRHGAPRRLPRCRACCRPPRRTRAHLARYGPAPYRGQPGALIADVEASGLTGRGGAAFPVHRKLAAVARRPAQGRKVVVANGAESEPASHKDELLLRLAPNLVLDGLQLAAEAVGATEAPPVPAPRPARRSCARWPNGPPAAWTGSPVTITQAPPRFLAGQETALVNRLGGGPALPTFQPPRVSERGLGGAPDPGAERRDAGPPGADRPVRPALVPRRRHRRRARQHARHDLPPRRQGQVREVGHRHAAAALLGDGAGAQAWLVGGYHGTWLPLPDAAGLTLDNASLRRFGAAAGAGVLAALPSDRCGLAETARVTRYLAAESAGQCGPCLNGLPRIAAALAELAGPGTGRADRWPTCKRWSGRAWSPAAAPATTRTARSASSAARSTVFGPKSASTPAATARRPTAAPFLPLPAGRPTRDEDWS